MDSQGNPVQIIVLTNFTISTFYTVQFQEISSPNSFALTIT